MSNRVRIKVGPVEVEYEGGEEYLREELPGLISEVVDLYRDVDIEVAEPQKNTGEDPGRRDSRPTISGTTSAIAQRLGADSGGELIMAAAAHLTFVKGKDSFERQELIDEMKSASSIFSRSYVSNLTSYIETLEKKDRLNEPQENVYALTPEARTDLEARLAG